MPTPREYRDVARQLVGILEEGTFLLVHGDRPLSELLDGDSPGDVVQHDFQCTTCGRRFHLFADTYHGGASWTPLD